MSNAGHVARVPARLVIPLAASGGAPRSDGLLLTKRPLNAVTPV